MNNEVDMPNKITVLFLWILLIEILSIIFSYLGYLPWYIPERWSINIQYASTLSIIGLLGYFIYWIFPLLGDKKLAVYSVYPVLFIYGFIVSLTCLFHGDIRDSLYDNLLERRGNIDDRYFVNFNAMATIRYLFEFGPFKANADVYPYHFVFETIEERDALTPIDSTNINIVLISHDSPGHYVPRLTNAFKDITTYKPSYMFEKVH